MKTHLPTFTSASWTVNSLCDSLQREISADLHCDTFRIFAYAVTGPGWRELRSTVRKWLRAKNGRSVVAFIGTDHALTEPDALRAMEKDGVYVRIMRKYHGIYHAKVFWLAGDTRHYVWVGSNNLTREGLLQNVEFATLIKSSDVNPELNQWFRNIDLASDPLDETLLTDYENQRYSFARKRSSAGTFTWRKREDPAPSLTALSKRPKGHARSRTRILAAQSGDLVVQVMPLETGLDGKQMQLPKEATVQFFSLRDRIGSSQHITLSPVGTTESRALTITIFGNNTSRLSIHELDYRDRPCVIVFHRTAQSNYSFEIVQQSIFPERYRALLGQCRNQTREGSRRWTIIGE